MATQTTTYTEEIEAKTAYAAADYGTSTGRSLVLNEIYDAHKEAVEGLHSLLWQLIMNQACKGHRITLTPIYGSAGVIMVGVAFESGGYRETAAYFRHGDYHKAADTCRAIGCRIWGHSEMDDMRIVGRSMAHGIRERRG